MNSDFKSVEEILNNTPEFSHINNLIDEYHLEKNFFKIFPELQKVIKSVTVSKSILKLSVEIPALRNELKFRETEIINKINKYYNQEKIKKVQFTNK